MLFDGFQPPDDSAECNKLKASLEAVAKGHAAQAPEFDPARGSISSASPPTRRDFRFGSGTPEPSVILPATSSRFWDDLALEPSPWKTTPTAWSLLCETALQRKAKNISPRLGGDLMRAVLAGTPYPRTLLSGVINRMRADGDINGQRAAICRAVINRNTNQEEIPMSLDRDNPNPAYRLGLGCSLCWSASSRKRFLT